MGREIRRVPPNWEHPRYTSDDLRPGEQHLLGELKSFMDKTFEQAMEEWFEGWQKWKAGTHEYQLSSDFDTDGELFHEYEGGPPQPESYRPVYDQEPTWFQVYETVSEGTPVTPPFETLEELGDYLLKRGDFSDQAEGRLPSKEAVEKFLESGYALSMAITGDGQVLNTYETARVGK